MAGGRIRYVSERSDVGQKKKKSPNSQKIYKTGFLVLAVLSASRLARCCRLVTKDQVVALLAANLSWSYVGATLPAAAISVQPVQGLWCRSGLHSSLPISNLSG